MIGHMGVLFGYYAADDDAHALGAIDRDDDGPLGAGYDGVEVKHLDPVVCLLPAEARLRGGPAAAVTADRARGRLVGMIEDGEVVTVGLSPAFRDALAAATPESLAEAAEVWSRSDASLGPSERPWLLDFLTDLAALATRAVARGQGLYCWICP